MFDLAIYYRMVGGFVGTGNTQVARMRWAFAMACYMTLVALVHHLPWLSCGIVFGGTLIGTFLGRLISHSRFQATASFGNSLGMAVVNILRLALIVAPYAFVSNWLNGGLVLFGAMSGVAYYIGNKYLNGKDSGIYFRNTHEQWHISVPPSQTGEVFTISMPGTTPEQNILDQAAVGGSEWGELLTGFLVYQLMYVAALVLL